MCKFCEQSPVIDPTYGYNIWYNELCLTTGGNAGVNMVIEPDGRISIVGLGDGRTDPYYPKFCPECGRQLTKNSAIDAPTDRS